MIGAAALGVSSAGAVPVTAVVIDGVGVALFDDSACGVASAIDGVGSGVADECRDGAAVGSATVAVTAASTVPRRDPAAVGATGPVSPAGFAGVAGTWISATTLGSGAAGRSARPATDGAVAAVGPGSGAAALSAAVPVVPLGVPVGVVAAGVAGVHPNAASTASSPVRAPSAVGAGSLAVGGWVVPSPGASLRAS